MQRPYVRQMTSPRTNNPVHNQFVINTSAGTYFQSYKTTIAFKPVGESHLVLDEGALDYSKTTSQYLQIFMRAIGPTYVRKDLIKSRDNPLKYPLEDIQWANLN